MTAAPGAGAPSGRYRAAMAAAGLAAVVWCAATGAAEARVLMTQDQALAAAFPPPARVERRTLYLDEAQAARVAQAAGTDLEARVVPYYVGTNDGGAVGYAYFDTHLVRTLAETVMVQVAPGGRIVRIDILSFDEPGDYLPRPRWLEQFQGRRLDDGLSLGGAVRPITGATLSSRAVTQAARRVLALHTLFVEPRPAPAGTPAASGERRP